MKYRIPKGSVQETLIIPLYGPKLAMDLYPERFANRDCQRLFAQIEYELPGSSGIRSRIGAIMGATRQFMRDDGAKPIKALVIFWVFMYNFFQYNCPQPIGCNRTKNM